MPPGASLLMRGLGMRGTDKYIKDQQRGRKVTGNYNRPKVFQHHGDNYPVDPRELYGDEPFQLPPGYAKYNTALVTGKYLDDSRRKSEGLSKDYIWRLFEYNRSQWPLYGFISPHKHDRGRARRDEQEFRLWHHWHPVREKLQEIMNEEADEEYDSPYDRIDNDAQLRGVLPGPDRYLARRRYQQPYGQRRGAVSHNRPRHHQRGLVDHRNPIYRPPYPGFDTDLIQRGTERRPQGPHGIRREKNPRQHPPTRRLQGPRGTGHPQHPPYGILGNGMQQGRFGQPPGDYYPTRPNRGNHVLFDHYDILDDNGPFFVPRREHPHHRPHALHEEDEDEDEEDTMSQHSTGSYVRRLSPEIVYPVPAPYHGRPLGHHSRRHGRHEDNIDDEDDEDELFLGRRGNMGRRGGVYGLGREGGRIRVGPRGYDREDLGYVFSGDEDDLHDV